MAKLAKQSTTEKERLATPQEFIDENGKMLFDDIDGDADDAWLAAMQSRHSKKAKTAKSGALGEDILDELSNLVHTVWSEWMTYQADKSEKQSDGSLVIPADLVQRWERQAQTAYDDLPSGEKTSDIEIAKRYFIIMHGRPPGSVDNADAE